MWFIDVSITGIEAPDDSSAIDAPDKPMTAICYTGTIKDTDIAVKLIFFGEVLDRCQIDLE